MKKKKLLFQTWLNYESQPHHVETPVGDSLTVPGEALTIPQIREKLRGGIPMQNLVNINEAHYTDNEDIENTDPLREPDLDLTDVMDLVENSEAILAEAEASETKKAKSGNRKTKTTQEDSAANEEDLSEESIDETSSTSEEP